MTADASEDVPSLDDVRMSRPDVACAPIPTGAVARPTSAPFAYPMDDVLRLNQIQVKGTHNSYHVAPMSPLTAEWAYTHAPLREQFDSLGVRKVELDVHWNEACERYEVYHVTQFDEGTRCREFTGCLQTLREWSDANPGHAAIFVQIEPKDIYRAQTAAARMDALDREILLVWPRELIITPDEVRGTSPTLAEAVRTRGWPTLGRTRGRILFFLNRSDALRDVYTHGGTNLDGRVIFAESSSTDPFAAVIILNDPIGDRTRIEAAVREGFIVRTFAETSLAAGRANDQAGVDAALAGGAQIVSTDFPGSVPGTDYIVQIPGGTPSRCNPINAPAGCTAAAIEDPALLHH